jgi:hypothetical protein
MKYIKLFEEFTEKIYHEYDFLGMWAQKLGMTREEYTSHYATATIGSGIDEAKAKSAKGKMFDVKGIRFTYIERNGKFYGTSLFDVAKTTNVGKAAKLTLQETNDFLKAAGIKEEAPYKYNEKELDVICKQLTKKGIECAYDDAMDI